MVPSRIFGILITLLPFTFAVEELILTPLIREGNLDKAKEMAINNINLYNIKSSLNKPITSYSGYLTINEAYNSNLFFWLFPAIENPDTSSVILVVNSIPGISLMQGIFLENGPFTLDENLELKEQNYTWAKTHTLIYIDSPVGSGFSFTDNQEGWASSSQEMNEQVYEAMKQIYTLFPEYQSRDLYFSGTSYAGRVIPKMVLTFEEKGRSDDFQKEVSGVNGSEQVRGGNATNTKN
ncbi:unnamed protein product [Allacma fusca]|uniref:Serine carboxypeptidase n=1 Tax=Allacma fusca TaxID=39272 RepID=A0A8J2J618_9HEXA|nr:unnamed protein product [Allacma fusca]